MPKPSQFTRPYLLSPCTASPISFSTFLLAHSAPDTVFLSIVQTTQVLPPFLFNTTQFPGILSLHISKWFIYHVLPFCSDTTFSMMPSLTTLPSFWEPMTSIQDKCVVCMLVQRQNIPTVLT